VRTRSLLNVIAMRLLLLLAVAALTPLASQTLSVCQTLDQSLRLNGRTVRVRGFLGGSTQHGFFLFHAPDYSSEPCRGWPRTFLTAPAILDLGSAKEPGLRPSRLEQDRIDRVFQKMRDKERRLDFSPVAVEVTGRLRRKWFAISLRWPGSPWVGNGFGVDGDILAQIEVQAIRELDKP
jgi:hypothetical protein